jgi:hypothetical protein
MSPSRPMHGSKKSPRPGRCPRCKGSARYYPPDDDEFHYVVCKSECGMDSAWALTRGEAIDLWNRAEATPIPNPDPRR